MYNQEIRNRILVSVAAYAYEYLNAPIMSDSEFDALAQQIDVTQDTGNKNLDDFLRITLMLTLVCGYTSTPKRVNLNIYMRNITNANKNDELVSRKR